MKKTFIQGGLSLILLSTGFLPNESTAADEFPVPERSCPPRTNKTAAILCTAKLWCPDCGLNDLYPNELTTNSIDFKSIQIQIDTPRLIQLGTMKGTGKLTVRRLVSNSEQTKICPEEDGYILVGQWKSSQCVPLPKGKSIPLKMTKGLTQLLKTFQYENVSFRKSIYSPYSLHFATLTIKAGQTVCGVHFPSKTQVIFNEMEIDDDSFEVRPTTPIVANGKTYPKYTGRMNTQYYWLFDGEKCSVKFRIDDEPDEENLDPFK
ncbi:MAG: hypothetical protein JNJ49_08000 [Bdellovibrionaceae bacterium]|nr:hypothetical protein [Pseudobdellovibrionaceae bacterium]